MLSEFDRTQSFYDCFVDLNFYPTFFLLYYFSLNLSLILSSLFSHSDIDILSVILIGSPDLACSAVDSVIGFFTLIRNALHCKAEFVFMNSLFSFTHNSS